MVERLLQLTLRVQVGVVDEIGNRLAVDEARVDHDRIRVGQLGVSLDQLVI
jgi:hypothetical protein